MLRYNHSSRERNSELKSNSSREQHSYYYRLEVIFGALTCLVAFGLIIGIAGCISHRLKSEAASPVNTSADEVGRDVVLKEATQQSNQVKDEVKISLNDSSYSQAWGLKTSEAAKAWEVSQGSKNIVVAVIDTGADVDHEDLKNNIWVNRGELGTDSRGRSRSSNGIDDDGNGFVDDVHGWNFVSNDAKLTDHHGHGTHIAGIIGAEAGNGKGVAGIAPKVSLMILKYFDPKVPNTDNLKTTVAALKYAIRMRANIINYSGGGNEYSPEEREQIEEARRQGILVVAAAGNERSNSDHHHYYPADYGLSNIISVTAIDPSTEVLHSSNYGVETVDLAAPGQNILSTLPNNSYGVMTGTSQATAFVTGAAVLVMADKKLTAPEEVKKYILATGDSRESLSAKTKTSRQLNLYKAVTMEDSSVSITGLKANLQLAADPTSLSVRAPTATDELHKFANFLHAKMGHLNSN